MECESETCVDILNGKIYKGIAYMGEMWGGYPEYGSWIYVLAVECESKCIRRMKIEGEWRILRGWLEDIWMREWWFEKKIYMTLLEMRI